MPIVVPARVRSSASAAPHVVRATTLAAILFVLCSCGGTSGQPTGPQVAAQSAESASGAAGSVLVQTAFIPAPAGRSYSPGSVIALQLVVTNKGSSWDELTSVTTPVARSATFRQFGTTQPFISVTTDPQQNDAIAQLEDTTRTVRAGERVPVTFHFSSAGTLTLQVPVRTEAVPPRKST